MKRIYSHSDLLVVNMMASFLESKGIQVLVQGEHRLGASGGIPPLESWPEIVLIDKSQEQIALEFIKEFESKASSSVLGEKWTCPNCGEKLDPQFNECWKCQPKI